MSPEIPKLPKIAKKGKKKKRLKMHENSTHDLLAIQSITSMPDETVCTVTLTELHGEQ